MYLYVPYCTHRLLLLLVGTLVLYQLVRWWQRWRKQNNLSSIWNNMLVFHVEVQKNSTWNVVSVDPIEGLLHTQITDRDPIFLWKPDPRVCKTPLGSFWSWPCKTWRQPEENRVICWHFGCLSKIWSGLGSEWGLDRALEKNFVFVRLTGGVAWCSSAVKSVEVQIKNIAGTVVHTWSITRRWGRGIFFIAWDSCKLIRCPKVQVKRMSWE